LQFATQSARGAGEVGRKNGQGRGESDDFAPGAFGEEDESLFQQALDDAHGFRTGG
jgi:hypothetical protein